MGVIYDVKYMLNLKKILLFSVILDGFIQIYTKHFHSFESDKKIHGYKIIKSKR
ncbi:MAG: hypothetical protein ACI8ZO_001705 [Flavobacteriales bacterium]|jgi:hypothetical protein